ncbi:PucR family transcriptional regulator [Arthrobacter sp. Sa2BUA2]|uniref:PucR family transcriptional regulator n=1 Tax=Arthrobacter pullicola TaxID=2762224 RepID=A0ABR8YI72_9MICC|nr:PucR family transcriptional regulator [Arthrobacter pullicola]MBD8043923.1 PucR family transcriptional regulator [Arthrobacter pullicola]
MVSLPELSMTLGPSLVPVGLRRLPSRQLTGVHVSELEDPTPYLEGGELLLTTGMPLGGSPLAAAGYVARLRAKGIHALGIGLGPWLEQVPAQLVQACDEAGIHLLTVPDGVPFQQVSRAFWTLSARSGQADLLGSLGTQTALAQATMRPDGTSAVVRGLAQALGGWAAFLPADQGPARYWPESTGALLPLLRTETIRLNRAGTHSAATFEIHGQAVVEYAIPHSGRNGRNERIHGFLAVGPGRKLTAADRQVITTVCTLLALKARQREAASGTTSALASAVAKLLLHGHTEAARILAEDVGLPELPRRVRVLALRADGADATDLLPGASALVPEPGVPPLPRDLAACSLRHEREGVLYVLLPQDASPAETGAGEEAVTLPAEAVPGLAGAVSEPVSLGEVPGLVPGLSRTLGQAAPGSLAGTGNPHHAAAQAWVQQLAGYPRADLVGTVTEYLRHRGHWENTSRALGVHRNSLRHRISLAVSLLGVDLDDPDVSAPLWLELRQYGR